MTSSFHHGISPRELNSGVLPMRTASTSIIGIVVHADDADPEMFPLNTPVRVSSISRALAGAGYQGTFRRVLEAIQPITNPTMVVVRIEDPTVGELLSSAAVIGQNVDGQRTGLQCLLTAKSVLGLKPKILAAPFLETPDVVQALIAIAKKLRGLCYVTPRDSSGNMLATEDLVVQYRQTLGDREVELIWPEWTSGNILLNPTTDGLSQILLYALNQSGYNDLNPAYEDTLSVTVNGLTTVSEPWSYDLEGQEGAADQWVFRALENAGLLVSTYIDGDVTYNWQITAPPPSPLGSGSVDVLITPTSADRVKFRTPTAGQLADYANDLLNPVTFSLSNQTNGSATYGAGLLSAVATAIALRAEIDQQIGWHKSLSNVVVNGVTGISQPLTWDVEDPDTDVGYLNANEVTSLLQNEGFRFWGNRTCSSDPRFAFEVATRTAQVIIETLVDGCFPFIDQPLQPSLAKDIIDSIQAKLDEFVGAGRLIGASVWYDPEQNSAQTLSQGQLWIDYDFTPVPTLEHLGLNQRITDRYLVDFAKLIAQAA
ncbi:MAG: phage tail sheath C-terminal domain-containing protein [Pseudomonadota bacterium]|nr:phage tail sheath C-terminal domain-containing protein [Pseudomonadota bacterium]